MTSLSAPPGECVFCGAAKVGDTCPACRRDTRASRRICARCSRQTPLDEPVCCHCGIALRSDLSWKVPLIVFLFLAATAVATIVHLLFRM